MFVNKPSVIKYVVADGNQFPFEFKFFADTDIRVWYVPPGEDPDDELHALSLNTDYTVTSNTSKIGGAISISVPLINGGAVTVARLLPVTRSVDYASRGAFKADTMDADQDYQTYLLLDQLAYSSFFYRAPISGGTSNQFPDPEPSQYIGWNTEGTALENKIPIAGSVWYAGASNPSDTGGKDDDMYLNVTSGDVFKKINGVWKLQGNIEGPQGEVGPVGPIGPDGIQGETGQGIIPVGAITVAELNLIDPATLTEGMVFIMLDGGTVTVGITPVTCVANDWLGWGLDGSFANLGPIIGPTGPIGDTGATGAPGVDGEDGVSPTLNVDPVAITGAPGSVVSVINTGTPADAVFKFTIPRGDLGITGDTGPVGPVGGDSTVPGPVGPVGPIGPAGAGLIFHGYNDPAVIVTLTATSIGDAYTANVAGVDSDGTAVAINDVLVADDLLTPSHWVSIGAVQGPTGAVGAVGADGADGAVGAVGADGTSATVGVGAVSKIAPGGTPTVVNSGTALNAILDFGLVTGDTGATGVDGDTWLILAVNPTTEGKDGDLCLNNLTFDVFEKIAGTWGQFGNLGGPVGPTGADGADGIDGTGLLAGVMVSFAGAVAPDGYLPCNGQEVAQATYPALYTAIGDLWATTGGAPAPVAGNFRLPPQQIDGLGNTLRGVGTVNGPVGTFQLDALKEHTHAINVNSNGTTFNYTGGTVGRMVNTTTLATIEPNVGGDVVETRGRVITTLLCIKAFDTLTNPELVDVSKMIVSDTAEATGSDAVVNMVSLTQAEYDALPTKVATTLYIITDVTPLLPKVYVDELLNRLVDTDYPNDTNDEMWVFATTDSTTGCTISASVDGLSVGRVALYTSNTTAGLASMIAFPVPAGSIYKVTSPDILDSWVEYKRGV